MPVCWIVYDGADLEPNRFFAERLASCGRDLGMETLVVTTGDLPPGIPDAAVNRSRDWRLARGLEEGGTVVLNSSEVTRICSDKLETYRLADGLGVPHMPVSLPGEPFPPGPPWVVKSRVGHGGTEVFLAGTEGDAADLVRRLDGRLPLVQSMADPGRDMRVYVLGDEVIAAVMRSSEWDFRANHGLGGSIGLCGVPEDAVEMVEKMVSGLGPDLVGIDFVFRDGSALLNEVEDAAGTRMLYELTGLDPARLLMERAHSKMSL